MELQLRKGLIRGMLWLLCTLLMQGVVIGAEAHTEEANVALHADSVVMEQEATAKNEEKFNPSRFIFDHIADSHSWHIFSIGKVSVSIPLPVIVYSRYRKEWFCFLSSAFDKGSHCGLRLDFVEDGGRAQIVEDTDQEVPKPIDLSITKNVVGLFFVVGLMLWMFISTAHRYSRGEGVDNAPRGIQNVIEPVVIFIRDQVAIPNIGEKHAGRFVPFLLTLFFFILLNNLLGLIPIFPAGANVTGNISVTMTLAFATFLVTNVSGNKNYWRHVFNTPGMPVYMKLPVPIIPLVELFGVVSKPFVLMIRLFANMLSGHMIILVFMSMIFLLGAIHTAAGYAVSVMSVTFAMFITLLDVLVSFVQAYIFTLLSAVYVGGAVAEAEE